MTDEHLEKPEPGATREDLDAQARSLLEQLRSGEIDLLHIISRYLCEDTAAQLVTSITEVRTRIHREFKTPSLTINDKREKISIDLESTNGESRNIVKVRPLGPPEVQWDQWKKQILERIEELFTDLPSHSIQ